MGPQRSLDLSLVSISLCAKFQTFSSILSGRFWRGVLVLLVLLVVVVTGGKQSQLLVLSLSVKYDKKVA